MLPGGRAGGGSLFVYQITFLRIISDTLVTGLGEVPPLLTDSVERFLRPFLRFGSKFNSTTSRPASSVHILNNHLCTFVSVDGWRIYNIIDIKIISLWCECRVWRTVCNRICGTNKWPSIEPLTLSDSSSCCWPRPVSKCGPSFSSALPPKVGLLPFQSF